LKMWMARPAASSPVDNVSLSPVRANRRSPVGMRLRPIIPVVHTLYDYDKGIS
jgi:hypothetical protein